MTTKNETDFGACLAEAQSDFKGYLKTIGIEKAGEVQQHLQDSASQIFLAAELRASRAQSQAGVELQGERWDMTRSMLKELVAKIPGFGKVPAGVGGEN